MSAFSHNVGLQVAELLERVGAHLVELASSDEIQPRGEGAQVGGRVAVGAVGVQVVVLATSSWGKFLAVVHAALVCSSRTRQAAAMLLAGRSARCRDAREDSGHQNER